MTHLETLLIAIILDAIIGDPDWIWRRLPHPTALMGALVRLLDQALNSGRNRKFKGVIALTVLVSVAFVSARIVQFLPFGPVAEILLTAILLAQNSLARHIQAIARALENGLQEGRKAVSMVVGRDVECLDENAVVRSAIESTAENFSDGFLAPAFWALMFGLPGIMIYKMVNTADSMIGYTTPKYSEFGWAAARFDDIINWVPARLAGVLIAVAHGSASALGIMLRDAPLHRSPNAGWPESAMAAVLGVAISGPRIYNGQKTEDPFVNAEGRHVLIPNDIDYAVKAMWRVWWLCFGAAVLVWGMT